MMGIIDGGRHYRNIAVLKPVFVGVSSFWFVVLVFSSHLKHSLTLILIAFHVVELLNPAALTLSAYSDAFYIECLGDIDIQDYTLWHRIFQHLLRDASGETNCNGKIGFFGDIEQRKTYRRNAYDTGFEYRAHCTAIHDAD